MIYLFKKFLKNKIFIIYISLFLVLIYLVNKSYLPIKIEYMMESNITNNNYLLYSVLLPIVYYDNSILESIILDLSYYCIVSYLVVSYVDLFFNEMVNVIFTKIKRDISIKNILICNIIFSFTIVLGYILYFYILFSIKKIDFIFDINVIILLIIKILITLLITNLYINLYINTKNIPISLILPYMLYVVFELLIRLLFSNLNYIYIIIFLLIVFNYYIYLSNKKIILRSDL